MKSHALAKILLTSPDVELVLQTDPEGNGYERVQGVDFDIVYVQGRCEAEVYDRSWTADEACLDEEEWEEIKRTHSGYAVIYP
jgi:hypothetical protein